VSATPPSSSEPHSDAATIAVIAQLRQQLAEKTHQVDAQQKQLRTLQSELDYAQLKIRVLEERLRKQRIERYGRRTRR
jgi:septal ring factor EnvC (AmiA/AmiB activator)